jgi:hypothetical protein
MNVAECVWLVSPGPLSKWCEDAKKVGKRPLSLGFTEQARRKLV